MGSPPASPDGSTTSTSLPFNFGRPPRPPQLTPLPLSPGQCSSRQPSLQCPTPLNPQLPFLSRFQPLSHGIQPHSLSFGILPLAPGQPVPRRGQPLPMPYVSPPPPPSHSAPVRLRVASRGGRVEAPPVISRGSSELSECFGDIAGTELSANMSHNSLNMPSQLMLGQAQVFSFECVPQV
eukprot:196188_1